MLMTRLMCLVAPQRAVVITLVADEVSLDHYEHVKVGTNVYLHEAVRILDGLSGTLQGRGQR